MSEVEKKLAELEMKFGIAMLNDNLEEIQKLYREIVGLLDSASDIIHPATKYKFRINIKIVEKDLDGCFIELVDYEKTEDNKIIWMNKVFAVLAIAVNEWRIPDAPVRFISKNPDQVFRNYNRLFAKGMANIFKAAADQLNC